MKINPISPIYRTKKRKKPDDKEFLAWIRTQKSAVSGKTPCVAAHYRTSKNSGIGIKPLFSAIPLTDDEHRYQHQVGQYNFMSRERWELLIEFYVNEWKKHENR